MAVGVIRVAVVGMLVAVGVAIGLAWGPGGALVYAFCAAVAGAFTYAVGVAGDFVRDLSSRRFEDDSRRR